MLMRFQPVKSSVNGNELAVVITEVFYRKLNILPGCHMVATGRDMQGHSQHKGPKTVSEIYPEMLNVGCTFHFIDRVGTNCEAVHDFLELLLFNERQSKDDMERTNWKGYAPV